MTSSRRAPLLLLLTLWGCASGASAPPDAARHDAPLADADLGSARAAQATRFGDGETREQPADGFASASLEDIALLTTRAPQVCVELILQTEALEDRPLSELTPKCEVDGREVAFTVTSERAVSVTYQISQRPLMSPWETFDVGMPVTTRRALLCCDGEATHEVQLSLHNALLSERTQRPWRASWRWALRGD